MIGNGGSCWTHGKPYTKTACTFAGSQSVAVEWQPTVREVWWWVVGTDKQHGVSIPSELLKWGPLHFVAMLSNGGDASLVS